MTRTATGSRTRRAALVLAAAGTATAALVGAPTSASAADAQSRVAPIGPGLGLQCVTAFAQSSVFGSGYVVSGQGANFQLRVNGIQVAGSGAQVGAFSAFTQPGFPGWYGPGDYQFCARNNGSFGSAFISIQTT